MVYTAEVVISLLFPTVSLTVDRPRRNKKFRFSITNFAFWVWFFYDDSGLLRSRTEDFSFSSTSRSELLGFRVGFVSSSPYPFPPSFFLF